MVRRACSSSRAGTWNKVKHKGSIGEIFFTIRIIAHRQMWSLFQQILKYRKERFKGKIPLQLCNEKQRNEGTKIDADPGIRLWKLSGCDQWKIVPTEKHVLTVAVLIAYMIFSTYSPVLCSVSAESEFQVFCILAHPVGGWIFLQNIGRRPSAAALLFRIEYPLSRLDSRFLSGRNRVFDTESSWVLLSFGRYRF